MNRLHPWVCAMAALVFFFSAPRMAQTTQPISQTRRNAPSPSVRSMQQQLQREGYYQGRIDGVMGPQTRNAWSRYQHDHNRASSGARALAPRTPTTGQYYRSAGRSISGSYGQAGREVGGGAKGMAEHMRHGEVGSGVKQFGAGIGKGAKSVGRGTGEAAKNAFRGTKHAVTP